LIVDDEGFEAGEAEVAFEGGHVVLIRFYGLILLWGVVHFLAYTLLLND
jgi:hypothetical protein